MSFNTVDYAFNMSILREKHKAFHLTDIHYVIFKQYLMHTLRETGAKDKELYLIANRMDGFKACITNKDSLKELIDNYKGGSCKINYIYYKLLLKEKSL